MAGAATVLLALALLAVSRADEDEPEPPPVGERPKAVFQTDVESGRDPFFPESTRRQQFAAQAPSYEAAPLPIAELVLRGILGSPEDRLALINSRIFTLGDEGFVNVPSGRILVRCLEIREDSAVVAVGDNPKTVELRLRAGQ
jgi:hypothetical protein